MPDRLRWTPGRVDSLMAAQRAGRLAPSLAVEMNGAPRTVDVRKEFSREELFKIAYVPFVIAELVWDYAGTVLDIAAQMKIRATREPARLIRKAREMYKARETAMLRGDFSAVEMDNALVFEDKVRHIMEQMSMNLRLDLRRWYPLLQGQSVALLDAVHQCLVLYLALMRYMERQKAFVMERTGHTHDSIVPKEIHLVGVFVPLFIGDKPLSDDMDALMTQYVATVSNQIGLIRLDEFRKS